MPGGSRVTAPDTFQVGQPATATSPERRKRGPIRVTSPIPIPLPSTADSTNGLDEALLESLAAQDLRVADTVELQPRLEPTPPSGRRRAQAPPIAAEQTALIDVDVSERERAVVLVEQDGVYAWVLPSVPHFEDAGSGRRESGTEHSRTSRFEIPIKASRPSTREPKRGLLGDIIFGRVKAYVLKFVARLAVEYGISFLERHIEPSLVKINSVDSRLWKHCSEIDASRFSSKRAPQVLLLIHGTFSSTIGAFGALGATPWGRSFLQACLRKYDVILGFDHRTLSEDPSQNAEQILKALLGIAWGEYPPHLDAVAHSRGGLVLRSLADQWLAESSWKPQLGSMVLVGATNGGTELANYQNWKAFADLYTNMAVFACRALTLVPAAGPVAHITKEVVSSVGSLVKYLAFSTVEAQGVPGLSAMSPEGDFISAINLPRGAPQNSYCVVTSEFAPRIISENEVEPKEMPLRFAAAISEGLVTQLMKGAANDIVVDTKSMSAIHSGIGHAVADALNFGATPLVYHTNYFSRPEVTNALARWFMLTAPPVARAVRTKGPRRGDRPSSFSLPPALAVSPGSRTPAGVDTDVIVTSASASVAELLEEIDAKAPSFVVVNRPFEGRVLRYALTPSELIQRAGPDHTASLLESLSLHEYESIRCESEQETASRFRAEAAFPSRRTIVMRGTVPIGIVPSADESVIPNDLSELARITMQPASTSEISIARRTMPTLGVAKSKTEPEATCYFHSSMREQTILGREATVTVSVSREILDRVAGVTSSGSGPVPVDTGRKLLIQVFPKSGWDLVDDSGPIELDVPDPGRTDNLYFQVVSTALGRSEIWVVIRQRQVPLVTLKLFPVVVETARSASPSVQMINSEARSVEAPAGSGSLHQLTILEQKTRDGTVFHFDLRSESLNVLKRSKSEAISGDRKKYVENIYHDIETRWISSNGQAVDFDEAMREIGNSLLRDLVPMDLQQVLWDSRHKLDSIFVVSEEPFIPWEIVHLSEPGKAITEESLFLGELGLVRWLYEADRFPPLEIRVAAGRAFYLVPDYPSIPEIQLYPLPEASKEKQFLLDRFSAQAVDPQPAAVRKLLVGPASFDLLHFAGHGMAASDGNNEPQLLLQGETLQEGYVQNFLRANTVETRANLVSPQGNRPIVTVNACQAGRATYKLTGIGGFAEAFLARGAGCFVGTLWSVTDSPARYFTESFYTALLGDGKPTSVGDTIAVATRKARDAAKKSGDSTWLSYVVYGHPHARIIRTK